MNKKNNKIEQKKPGSTEARTRGPQNKSQTRYPLDSQSSLNWEREKRTLYRLNTMVLKKWLLSSFWVSNLWYKSLKQEICLLLI